MTNDDLEQARIEAEAIVEPHTFMHNQFRAVSFDSCRLLLGARFDLLLADPLRAKGPIAGTIYPWNVVDYLIHENPRAKKNKQKGAGPT